VSADGSAEEVAYRCCRSTSKRALGRVGRLSRRQFSPPCKEHAERYGYLALELIADSSGTNAVDHTMGYPPEGALCRGFSCKSFGIAMSTLEYQSCDVCSLADPEHLPAVVAAFEEWAQSTRNPHWQRVGVVRAPPEPEPQMSR